MQSLSLRRTGTRAGTAEPVAGGVEAETRRTMENIGAVLKENGLGFGDFFKCTVMLADVALWPAFNDVYPTNFDPDRLPARSAFGASGLVRGGPVEVECMVRERRVTSQATAPQCPRPLSVIPGY